MPRYLNSTFYFIKMNATCYSLSSTFQNILSINIIQYSNIDKKNIIKGRINV